MFGSKGWDNELLWIGVCLHALLTRLAAEYILALCAWRYHFVLFTVLIEILSKVHFLWFHFFYLFFLNADSYLSAIGVDALRDDIIPHHRTLHDQGRQKILMTFISFVVL